jgi:trigger factor
VVEAVAEAESIAVSDEEVEEQIRSDAEASERTYEDLRADIDRVEGFERLREDIMLRKAVDVIVAGAVPIEPGQAEAREKLWTPDKERGGEEKTLWTPGSGPRQGDGA